MLLVGSGGVSDCEPSFAGKFGAVAAIFVAMLPDTLIQWADFQIQIFGPEYPSLRFLASSATFRNMGASIATGSTNT